MTEPARRIERSSNFSGTMSEMIRTALRLTTERRGQLPSIAVLAHAMKMNRTTAYYYFQSPGALRGAILEWIVARLVECMALPDFEPGCMGDVIQFVLDNSYGVNLLLEDLLSQTPAAGDLSWWRELVDAMTNALGAAYPGAKPDAEVHVAWLLGGALNGPRILQRHGTGDTGNARIIQRFRDEERRLIPSAVAA